MEPRHRSPTGEVPAVAGVKRPAPDVPTLLPAFEPLSSSPALPRPIKRVARESPKTSPCKATWTSTWALERSKYPTPVPTSSTGLISSSPPRVPRRPGGLQRTISSLSERAPLASVPSIELDAGGEETLMGRSGRSSTYQLSTNKLISRVHVRAAYVPANPPNPAKVELSCTGWNGVKIHCQGKAWDLAKGDTFTSESQDADIMIDVQDARVLLQWPKAARKANTPATTDSSPEDENSPSRGGHAMVRRAAFASPLRSRARLQSPISPTPVINTTTGGGLGSRAGESAPIQIYEDESAPEMPHAATQPTQSTQRLTQPLGESESFEHGECEVSDIDEENDPLVHSFQATGENLLSRMADVRAGASPEQARRPSLQYFRSPLNPTLDVSRPAVQPIINHVVNQLAFSRVASTPLSTILGNLPAALKEQDPMLADADTLTRASLQAIIDATPCIGGVAREGKDAAGKALESEYYYVPDEDFDENRRAAVVDRLQKPGLRNCRKSHKQYYWKKPR